MNEQYSKQHPRRVKVAKIIQSRYEPGKRPVSWDKRLEGIEQIKTADGEVIALFSGGSQSTPAPGWELLLTQGIELDLTTGDHANIACGTAWTLYGLAPQPVESAAACLQADV